jgi:Coenzyme PQQ synthesis protein D (PqqD)
LARRREEAFLNGIVAARHAVWHGLSADGENEIIKRCTGEVTFGEIVDDLAKTYAAPREKILADVGALLRGLADKTLGIVIKTGQVIGSKVTWRYRVPQWCTSRSVCSPS